MRKKVLAEESIESSDQRVRRQSHLLALAAVHGPYSSSVSMRSIPAVLPALRQPNEDRDFIEPPQAEVIEKILRHCGLWQEPTSRAQPDVEGMIQDLDWSF
jgi:hypothetical protein